MLGSEQDPTWRGFPQALMETQGARRYITLFEAPFKASVLSDHENNALWVSSLMAMPPPAPGMTSLSGLMTVDLPGSSLTQWASHIQDVTSGMRMPPEMAGNCPQADIVGILNWLENLTPVKYCHFCFGVGRKCRCSNVPRQTPSQGSGLWTPPMMSYSIMASPIETMASSSVGGVPPLRYPPPGLPPLDPAMMSYTTMASLPEAMASSSVGRVPPLRYPPPGPPPCNQVPMDMLLAPSTEDLLATAGVGRGGRGRVITSNRALDTYHSWPWTGTTFGHPAVDAHPRKAGGGSGNPLPAAGVSATTLHWGTDGHHQSKHCSQHQSGP